MNVYPFQQAELEKERPPLAECDSLLAVSVHGMERCRCDHYPRRLDLSFAAVTQDCGQLQGPTEIDAKRIVDFARGAGGLAVSCGTGIYIGRAVRAALGENTEMWDRWTGSRDLYRRLMVASGQTLPRDPLVAIIVNAGTSPEHAIAMLLALRRQRWTNWQATFCGPAAVLDALGHFYAHLPESNNGGVRFQQTHNAQERWGHGARRMAIMTAISHGAQWIGLQADDNYLCPGYIEQLVESAKGADLVLTDYLSSFRAFDSVRCVARRGSADLGAFLVHRTLAEKVPWEDGGWDADGQWVEKLAKHAKRVVTVSRPLYTHC